jgi:hypothetical protein
VLEGPAANVLLPVLVPLLDGTRSVSQIISTVGEEFAPAVENALSILAAHRLLTNGPGLPDDAPPNLAETVWQLASTDSSPTRAPSEILSNLMTAQVRVVGSSRLATKITELLGESGLPGLVCEPSLTGEVELCDLLIATPNDQQLPHLLHLNRAALEARTTWLPVLPFDGRFAGVGPLIVPWETCCYGCYLVRRLAASRYVDTSEMTEIVPTFFPTGATIHGAQASVAANIAIRWLGLSDPFLPGRLHALEFTNGIELGVHDVLRVPRCDACSPAARTPMPFPWLEAASLPASGLGPRR